MSNIQKATLPDIGDYKDVPVIEITVQVGDTVKVDDPVITLETDKATMEVPSSLAGRVSKVLVSLGDKVSMGSEILEIETQATAADVKPETQSAAAQAVAQGADVALKNVAVAQSQATATAKSAFEFALQAPAAAAVAPQTMAHASPSIRAFARELGVNLIRVPATGTKGRVLREDVLAYVKSCLAGSADAPGGEAPAMFKELPHWPKVDFAKFGEIERQPLTRVQEISGASLARNYLTIPHVTNFDNADVTELENFRVAVNGEKRAPSVKLTMVAFLIKASAFALKAHPRFNSSLEGKDLILKKYVNVGFAVDTPKGLMVPVVRDCDRKGIIEIADEMSRLAEKARQGTLSPSEMQGGCFSVSSLGGIGGAGFTPIINAPEVAILGAARSTTQAVWNGSGFDPRLIMPISLSWDHRVLDGVAAARFLGHISTTLNDFRRALL